RAMLPKLNLTQHQGTEAPALQTLDGRAEGGEHPPHLTLTTLDEHDAKRATSRAGLQHVRADGARQAIVQHYAVVQLVDQSLVDRLRARHVNVILLLDAKAGMRQPKRQLAVIGHQDEALRVDVQAADRVQPPTRMDKINDRRTAFGIMGRADHADWFV